MRILMIMHSHTRWLVLIAAVLVIIKFAWSWLRGDSFQKIDRILAAAFGGLLDLQATLGLIVLLWNGLIDGAGFPMNRIEHATTMIIAVTLGHLPARWKNAGDNIRFRNTLFCTVAALILIYAGVMRLRGGWVW